MFTSIGNRYAIDVNELMSAREAGLTYSVSCVDTEMARRLVQQFETTVVFIYRPVNPVELQALLRQHGAEDAADVEHRFVEAKAVLQKYTESLLLYDYVLLNIGSKTYFEMQARSVLRDCSLLPHEVL